MTRRNPAGPLDRAPPLGQPRVRESRSAGPNAVLRLCLLVCIALCPALPAAAQSWETYSHDAGRGAGVCPVDDAGTGNYLCFLISCAAEGGPLYLRVAFAGGTLAEKTPVLSVRVDDAPAETRLLAALPSDSGEDYGVRLNAGDAALLEALAGGLKAEFTLGTGPDAIRGTVPLKGSRRAIEALDGLCDPLEEAAARATGQKKPGREARASPTGRFMPLPRHERGHVDEYGPRQG